MNDPYTWYKIPDTCTMLYSCNFCHLTAQCMLGFLSIMVTHRCCVVRDSRKTLGSGRRTWNKSSRSTRRSCGRLCASRVVTAAPVATHSRPRRQTPRDTSDLLANDQLIFTFTFNLFHLYNGLHTTWGERTRLKLSLQHEHLQVFL